MVHLALICTRAKETCDSSNVTYGASHVRVLFPKKQSLVTYSAISGNMLHLIYVASQITCGAPLLKGSAYQVICDAFHIPCVAIPVTCDTGCISSYT